MRISDWSSDVCSSDLGEIAIVADRRAAALIEQSSLQRIEYGGMGLGRSAIMMPLVRLAGPLLVRSPATARYLPYVTALSWVIVALLAASGLAAAGARSEEHTSELQSLMRISYAVFCLQTQTTYPQGLIATVQHTIR